MAWFYHERLKLHRKIMVIMFLSISGYNVMADRCMFCVIHLVQTNNKTLKYCTKSWSVVLSACRSANIDLVLLIDGSKSVRPQNFELVKKFVNQVG